MTDEDPITRLIREHPAARALTAAAILVKHGARWLRRRLP